MKREDIEKEADKRYKHPQIDNMDACGHQAFCEGAEWMQRKMYWKARKAFCKTACPDGCPQTKDDIEGGGGLAVNCNKLKSFVKTMEK